MEFVLESGCYIDGLATKNFEREVAAYCGTKYALTVTNGTSALYLSLVDAGIGEGDEVLVPSHTFIATIEAIHMTGANAIYCDINPYTYNIRLDEIEKRRTKHTKAIIPVHMYGNMCAMGDILSFANRHNIAVIEDACQAIGSEHNGQRAGSFGDYGCFSFYPTKNLGAYGEGGAIVTDSLESYENLLRLRNHNASDKYNHEPGGFNFRMSEIQASILSVKLKYLDSWIRRRREIAGLYNKGLSDNVTKPEESKRNKHTYHLYVIRAEKRQAMCDRMAKRGIGFGIHYPIPCHEQYKSSVSLPFTRLLAGQILSLPCFPELTNSEVHRVCEVVNGK